MQHALPEATKLTAYSADEVDTGSDSSYHNVRSHRVLTCSTSLTAFVQPHLYRIAAFLRQSLSTQRHCYASCQMQYRSGPVRRRCRFPLSMLCNRLLQM
ncbi:hypothetical protein HBI56_022000 [Parastagonospora nodorum]|nr:hypothetical protein HBH52_204840 [Parastagonospora nodorum]KAH4058132.1 hypothetical protein HBH49_029150 [Parastagonospora nodorum]KAH4290952.1 hypothetical protein HBI01_195920 [Parastagonospora nodorum]KAH4317937.1 hypothetical protein HBI02_019040 [Parastagonospora nodorum]KAH4327045.1 hypothetical protein HBI00_135530 [Parastagonospora nodorum]